MARITIEDSLKKVSDRFALVVLSAQRARDLSLGAPALVAKNNDKYAVIALREIANSELDIDALIEAVIKRNQRKQILQVEDQYEVEDEEAESTYRQGMDSLANSPRKKNITSVYIDADDDKEED